MRSLAALAYWEGVILLGGFFGIVLWKLLTGRISLSQLLEGDVPDPTNPSKYSSAPSAGRAQLLVFTMFTVLYYLLQVLHNPKAFPKLPDVLVSALGGSQAVYLAGKAYDLLSPKLKNTL